MAENDRDMSSFMTGKSTGVKLPPITPPAQTASPASDEPPVAVEKAVEDVDIDLTVEPATVRPAPKKPVAKKPAAKAKTSDVVPLVKTSVGLTPELADQIQHEADRRNLWKTDLVHEALSQHLQDVGEAPRRKQRRGGKSVNMSLSFEPDELERLRSTGGPHGSVSWVVGQCLEMMFEAS